MGNTGRKIVNTLRLKNVTQNTYPGNTKPNMPGDPNYVEPGNDFTSCSIDNSLVCPVVRVAHSGPGSVFFELSVPNSVLHSPGFVKLTIVLYPDEGTYDDYIASQDCVDFEPNYFTGTFTGITLGGLHRIGVRYKNSGGGTLYTCSDLASITLAETVTWEPIDGSCEIEKTCGPGYTLDSTGTLCQQITTSAATPPSSGSAGVVAHYTNVAWNNGGAVIYAPGYNSDGSGTITNYLITPHFWVNGDTQWSFPTRNVTDGRMNHAGIWQSASGTTPINEWIGFVRRIDTTVAKTVYVGMAADNRFRFTLNGVDKIISPASGNLNGGPNFNYWNIYPVDLPAGSNFLEMWGLNLGSAAGFAIEVYDNTLSQMIAATAITDLTLLFSTKDLFGQNFNLGTTIGYSCPSGQVLDTSVGPPPVCQLITSVAPTITNTHMRVYANRRRLNNGVPDGFTEPNDMGGIGTYFAPVADPTGCP